MPASNGCSKRPLGTGFFRGARAWRKIWDAGKILIRRRKFATLSRAPPARPASRLPARPGHPLAIYRRSDRRFSNFHVPGARDARRPAGPEGPFDSPPPPAARRAAVRRVGTARTHSRRYAARRRAGFDVPARKPPSWAQSDCRAHFGGRSSATSRGARHGPLPTGTRRSGDAAPEKRPEGSMRPRVPGVRVGLAE